MDKNVIHEGPYRDAPNFDPPKKNGWTSGYWKETRSGDWYAFYGNTGPGTAWNIEHSYDPNWWKFSGRDGAWSGKWACRHGSVMDRDDCLTCGDHPYEITDEIIEQSKQEAKSLLDGIL